jgi:hypothetical protein
MRIERGGLGASIAGDCVVLWMEDRMGKCGTGVKDNGRKEAKGRQVASDMPTSKRVDPLEHAHHHAPGIGYDTAQSVRVWRGQKITFASCFSKKCYTRNKVLCFFIKQKYIKI